MPYSFNNPDPNADQALKALSDRYQQTAQGIAMAESPGLYSEPAAPATPSPGVKPLPGQPTVSGWQGGQYFWPQTDGGGSGGSRISRPRSGGSRSTRTGGSINTNPIIPEPTYQAPTAPTMPEYTAEAYAPPEEDKGYEAMKRREAMGAGQRELRQRTQEAIVGSRSLSNPAARKDFVRASLAGYGSGLEKVARGAGAEATKAARMKRGEQLQIYNAQYTAKSKESMVNYQNKLNQIMQDFSNQQWAAREKYATQKSAYMGQNPANLASAATNAAATSGKPNQSTIDWYRNLVSGPRI